MPIDWFEAGHLWVKAYNYTSGGLWEHYVAIAPMSHKLWLWNQDNAYDYYYECD